MRTLVPFPPLCSFLLAPMDAAFLRDAGPLVLALAAGSPLCLFLGWILGRRRERRALDRAGQAGHSLRDRGDMLLESGAMVQGVVEHAPAAIALKDLQGRYLLVNRRMEERLGRARADILGRTDQDLLPAEMAGRLHREQQEVLGLREALETEETWTLPDGRRRCYLSHKFPLVDAQGACWGLGVVDADLTERDRSGEATFRDQKREFLGLLTAGLANDFNNLLGAMQGRLDLLTLEQPAEARFAEHVRALEDLVAQAAHQVRQILFLSGQGPFHAEHLDLNRVVEEMIHLLRTAVARRAVLLYDPEPRLPPVEADPAQLRQLILNLVANGAEAMGEGGGSVTLRTGTEWLDTSYLATVYPGQDLGPGRYVSLEVADTGAGIPAGILSRIFEPFFSTKPNGRGLGLAVGQGILRGHRGGIRVFSETGRGTRIKVILPAAGPLAEAGEAPAVEGGFRGTGTVLVVDDEDSMRAVAVKLLNHFGFDALQARDGLEALRILDQRPGTIHLVLMDLTMPVMDGEEAYRELRQRGHRMPVVLSSGFPEREVVNRFRGQGLAGFLQKPYRREALVEVLRAALPA